MRNPGRKIWLFLALMLSGVGLCALAIQQVDRSPINLRVAVVGAIGLTLALIGLTQMMFALLHTRGRAKLLAGENVLTRWAVTPDEWEKFRVFDRIRAATPGTFGNDLSYDDEPPSQSVEIIVGRKSALIGDSYHVIRRGGIPITYALYWLPAPADPECLEFHIFYLRHRALSVRKTLRFPVPLRFRAEGIKVFEHFAPLMPRGPGIAVRRPALTIGVALAVAAVSASLFAWGAARIADGARQELAPLMSAIFGGMFGIAALLIALITALLARRRG